MREKTEVPRYGPIAATRCDCFKGATCDLAAPEVRRLAYVGHSEFSALY